MLAKERAKIWATDPHFDEKTRKTAAQMLENEEELLSAFGTELAFGTGGLRGVLGIGTNRMNEYTVGRATQGLADYLQEKDGKSVAIGYDSRLRSREFAYFAAGVLARNGLTAHVYPRLMPTPMLSFAVRELGCRRGHCHHRQPQPRRVQRLQGLRLRRLPDHAGGGGIHYRLH